MCCSLMREYRTQHEVFHFSTNKKCNTHTSSCYETKTQHRTKYKVCESMHEYLKPTYNGLPLHSIKLLGTDMFIAVCI